MRKAEFSKVLLFVDYLIMIVLIFLTIKFPEVDFITLDVAWIAQIGVSSGFYYWKAKADNRVKVPVKVLQDLPRNIRNKVDWTQVIVSIIQSD